LIKLGDYYAFNDKVSMELVSVEFMAKIDENWGAEEIT
jgi:hypothetical protein